MKAKYLYIAAAVLLAYWWWSRKTTAAKQAATPSGKVGTTGTAQTQSPFWGGWFVQSQETLNATTKNVADFTKSLKDLTSGISGLFGGSSTATGPLTPATAGSGAGQPINYAADTSENDSFETFF